MLTTNKVQSLAKELEKENKDLSAEITDEEMEAFIKALPIDAMATGNTAQFIKLFEAFFAGKSKQYRQALINGIKYESEKVKLASGN